MPNAAPSQAPFVEMIRHEPRRRDLVVKAHERITPIMLRLTLSGPSLADFASAAPDDHIKVFVPGPDGRDIMRDYTPRRFDQQACELVLDVVDHQGGAVADHVRQLVPGDRLTIGGPRGSRRIIGDIGSWLLIGDESALPAIARRVEEMAPGAQVTTLIAVPGPADEQEWQTRAVLDPVWVHRPLTQAADSGPLLAALAGRHWNPDTFIWIAAEAGVTRTLREHVLQARGHAPSWLKATGYWVDGLPGEAVKDLG